MGGMYICIVSPGLQDQFYIFIRGNPAEGGSPGWVFALTVFYAGKTGALV